MIRRTRGASGAGPPLTALIDTNILVRHLTGDPPELAARPRRIWEPRARTDRIDFAEAYLVACAESTGVGKVASFDRSIDRVDTIERIEPPSV